MCSSLVQSLPNGELILDVLSPNRRHCCLVVDLECWEEDFEVRLMVAGVLDFHEGLPLAKWLQEMIFCYRAERSKLETLLSLSAG